jgi:predicted metal-dependent enzyme (double-stranded beta helix superfamily)
MNTSAKEPCVPERAVLLDPLRDFVIAFGQLMDDAQGESELLRRGTDLLGALVTVDDWLPERYALPAADRYRQYLLHVDSTERFSMVSFVWGPGQTTPIHDHTTWGLIGMLRGAEVEQHYIQRADRTLVPAGEPQRLEVGAVDAVSPRIGDLHRVSNAYSDRTSISIHLYGGNIGGIRRSVYEQDGTSKEFVSGYSNEDLPNIWDRSKDRSTSRGTKA